MKKASVLGILGALTANTIFGFSFLFTKNLLNIAHPVLILAIRFTIAFAFMTLLIALRLVKVNFREKNLKPLLLMAIMQPFLYFLFELYGLQRLSSSLSGIIIALVPIAVIILSTIFLKTKTTAIQKFSTLLSLGGIIAINLCVKNTGTSHFAGVILLILAVISAGIFNILSQSQAKNFTAFERTYFMFFVGTLGFTLTAVILLRQNLIPSVVSAFNTPGFIFPLLYLAILSSVVAFFAYNYATSKVSAVQTSAFANVTTIISIFAGILILKEDFSLLQLIFCIPVILGIIGVNSGK